MKSVAPLKQAPKRMPAKWKLRQIMVDRKISNKNLAAALDVDPSTISRLRSHDILPAIGGEEIERIRVAINQLSPAFKPCRTVDLIEVSDLN